MCIEHREHDLSSPNIYDLAERYERRAGKLLVAVLEIEAARREGRL